MPRHKTATTHSRPSLNPPATLSQRARQIFESTVSSVDSHHFSPVDLPLLAQFASSAELAEKASRELEIEGVVVAGKTSAWVGVLTHATKSCVALSARLRICPQSRFDRLVAGTNSRESSVAARRAMERRRADEDPLLA